MWHFPAIMNYQTKYALAFAVLGVVFIVSMALTASVTLGH